MKISFQNQNELSINNGAGNIHGADNRQDRTVKGYDNRYSNGMGNGFTINAGKAGIRLDLGNNINGQNGMPGEDNGRKNSGKTLTELQQEAGAIDVGVAQDYQTVLSNTMSEEDYAKAQKEGFDYSSMSPEDVVTIQDMVKAELAKGGTVIAGYNDNMDSDVLAEAVGSVTLADTLKSSYKNANIPMTEENIEELGKAWSLAKNLNPLNDENVTYMLENELKPTIWNLYLSENSGATTNISNYYGSLNSQVDLYAPENDGLCAQVIGMLLEEHLSEDTKESLEEGLGEAQWLLSRNLPVTADNIRNYREIRSLMLPVTEDEFAKSAMAAVTRGESPVYADLTVKDSIYKMAADLEEEYFSQEVWEKSAGDLAARRQLEEIRLSMTAEVNVKLLSSGFSIDTSQMEELIDALKEAEKQVADKYFGKYTDNSADAVGSYRLMNETNRIVADIAKQPAASLGMFVSRSASDITLGDFHREGMAMRDAFIKAGESYETLMTAPRADLGDSIQKAFAGIESLVKEVGVIPTEENIRAARILGYNRMEISASNIEMIAEADGRVQKLIEKMTPASVLQMIRDGVNPLKYNFDELGKYFNRQDTGSFEEEAKDYSDFLFGLEMQDKISDEERESFIGVYRMLHQIEKSDGAVIGAVINEQAEFDFNNLISAVRSNKFKGLNIKVDDEIGETKDIVKCMNSITDQISTAFANARHIVEMAELRNAADTTSEASDALFKMNIPENADNLRAMDNLISDDNNLFEALARYEAELAPDMNNTNGNASAIANNELGNYASGRTTNLGRRSNARKGEDIKMSEIAQRAENALTADDFDSEIEALNNQMNDISEELAMGASQYIDIKALSLIHRQLGMVGAINKGVGDNSAEKEYIIPIDINGEISKVRLSFKNGEGDTKLDIKAAFSEGVAEAHFRIRDGRLEGYFVGNTAFELKKMESASDIFTEALKNSDALRGLEAGSIPVVGREAESAYIRRNDNSRSKDAEGYSSEGSERKVLLQVTKVFLQSVRMA